MSLRLFRALAIMELLSYQDLSITDILVAQVFHPSKAVREAAISVILKFNHGLIPDIFKRIEHNISDELSVFVKNLKHNQFAGEWRKTIFLRNSSAFSFIKRKMLPQLAENCSLIDLKKSKYYRASELFDDDEVILLVTEKFYIKDSNGKELRLKNDMLFLTSQLLKHHGEDILIKAGNDTAILKISEDDMREYIFDNEMEGMRIINKISECHEVFLNS